VAVAQNGEGATRELITLLTGYKRSTRDAYVQRLRAAEMVAVEGQLVRATPGGLRALGDNFEPLPTGERLRAHWLAKLPEGEAALLAELVLAWPSSVTRDDLSEKTGYKRSTRDAYIQRLKVRKLVTTAGGAVAASDQLFDAAGSR